MLDQYTLENFKKNSEGLYEIYDRFSFDNLFRLLLNSSFEDDEALDFVLCNCSLSAIVFQERIYNKYYLSLSTENTTSDDLVALRSQSLFELVANRYLDVGSKVGPVSELIRKCSPKSIKEWESYYFKNVYSKQHLEELGRRLYIKITEVCQAEIESIEEEDCINFITNLVINRTYDGYQSEIQTIYGQLQEALGVKVEPAPDEWDRGYNVDFFIKVKDRYIGLQIKPAGYAYIPQIINELEFQKKTHKKFTDKYGGKVFYVISVKEGKKKIIYNPEVIEEIRNEIERLKK